MKRPKPTEAQLALIQSRVREMKCELVLHDELSNLASSEILALISDASGYEPGKVAMSPTQHLLSAPYEEEG